MSAEKWMPSSFEILLSLKDLTVDSMNQSVQAPRLTALVQKAARRRALEELRAFLNVENSSVVFVDEIEKRIAEIEAEEGGEIDRAVKVAKATEAGEG